MDDLGYLSWVISRCNINERKTKEEYGLTDETKEGSLSTRTPFIL